jgi:hypothetical protein
MNDQIFETLNNSSTDELMNIVANKGNEFNAETVNYAKQILDERNVDVSGIPEQDAATVVLKAGDDEIKSLRFKAKLHIIFGPFLLIGGLVLMGFSIAFGSFPLATLLFVILGMRSIYLYFKLNNTARELEGDSERYSNSTLNPEQAILVKSLHDSIVYARNGDLLPLETFLTSTITTENFGEVLVLYRTEYFVDFIDEIRNVSNSYATIEKALQPLIKLGLVEPKYPHKVLIVSS